MSDRDLNAYEKWAGEVLNWIDVQLDWGCSLAEKATEQETQTPISMI